MRKSIGTHHGLVGLHHKTRRLADQAAGGQNLLRVNAHIKAEIVLTGFQSHDDFFE